ncbi:hypothetical protein C7S16_0928 [Burkholderia thailandensis]|uniref:Uncharacterized protein n=1 Tax=Burkholderia thailandensis TaxID=57975 RepID=A0AAW9D1A1_BURTH|nr:hypothetical protein [Burkholderia thailandensis]MDW9255921.1 hypothetical protein [Burkholderia thailandensis]
MRDANVALPVRLESLAALRRRPAARRSPSADLLARRFDYVSLNSSTIG